MIEPGNWQLGGAAGNCNLDPSLECAEMVLSWLTFPVQRPYQDCGF